MQVDSAAKIRNLAVAGHNDTGKTTLVSSLLYTSGVANRLQKVEDGHTVTDFDPEEVERGISIGLAPCFAPWKDHKINLLDCPGYGIFFTETQAAVRASDAVLLTLDTVSGIEVTTERTLQYAEEIGQPVILHLTKVDRERADVEQTLEALRESLGRHVRPVHLPIGKEGDFSGIVDLIHLKAYAFAKDGDGKAKPTEIPAEMQERVDFWRNKLVEGVAETDDELLEHFFESGDLPQDEIEAGLRRAVQHRQIFPVTLGSALHSIGTSLLLNTLVQIAPTPEDRGTFPATNVGGDAIEVETTSGEPTSALVFKTLSDPFTGKISIFRVISGEFRGDSSLWNSQKEEAVKIGKVATIQGKQTTIVPRLVAGDIGATSKLANTASGETLSAKNRPVVLATFPVREPAMSFAIEPKSKGDEEKIGEALHRLIDEDPTLFAGRDPETHEYLLSGRGQLHIEIAVAKLKKQFKVEVILHPPKVPYRETIRRAADGHGRHKKQTGGRGQFADCRIKMEPLTRGGDFEFVDKIFGGSIPQGFRPAVEKGIQEARARGYLAGYPVVDFRVQLVDGQFHDVDSSEMAFKVAGSLAFKDAMERAAPVLIEPYMQVEITTTEEFMGDIMGDLSQRRGRPQGMEVQGEKQVIKAQAPMAEMLDYARALRAMTQGRASFHMEMSHYEDVPKSLQDKIIQEEERRKQAEA